MKFPKHITLDVSHTSISNTYKPSRVNYDTLYKFTTFNSTINSNVTSPFSHWSSLKNQSSFTSTTTNLSPLLALCGLQLNSFNSSTNQNFSSTKLQVNNSLNSSLSTSFLEVDERIESKLTQNLGLINEQPTQNLFNIFFLRKEEIYTKLKYSRCPQYDMVSGGLAALFAAFLGFLICEKFGLELLDSGDFYIAFMYGVFATFSLRPLIRSMTKGTSAYNVISPKHLFNYLFILFNLIINFWK